MLPSNEVPTALGVMVAFGEPAIPPQLDHSDVWIVVFYDPNFVWMVREIPIEMSDVDYLAIFVERGTLAMWECEIFMTSHREYIGRHLETCLLFLLVTTKAWLKLTGHTMVNLYFCDMQIVKNN